MLLQPFVIRGLIWLAFNYYSNSPSLPVQAVFIFAYEPFSHVYLGNLVTRLHYSETENVVHKLCKDCMIKAFFFS